MAKVGRAAYAASRARLEVVTADKTITKNESGELYKARSGRTRKRSFKALSLGKFGGSHLILALM